MSLSVGPRAADYYLDQLPVCSSPSNEYIATATLEAFAFIGGANGVGARSIETPLLDEFAKIAPDFYKTLDSVARECAAKHEELCKVRRNTFDFIDEYTLEAHVKWKDGVTEEDVKRYSDGLGEFRAMLGRVSEVLNINSSKVGRIVMECMFVLRDESPVSQDMVALARGHSIPYIDTAPRPFVFDPDL
ncbi:hypothetical protein NPS46_21940 [Pseudomonas putida]|uniref:hypothetical protein n=1 Tax=Pseudomonas putida TaxID=303 RepID=UPI0023644605|nr:hypothetical protein [Pseudomonas putida]MDD2055216.1 hypothetical protein [Pseudomonas putida]